MKYTWGKIGSVTIQGIGEAALLLLRAKRRGPHPCAIGPAGRDDKSAQILFAATGPRAALGRRNEVLGRMLALGVISPSEYNSALVEVLRLAPATNSAQLAPYFVDYVRMQAQVLYDPRKLFSAGLNIYTTLQPEMAAAAQTAIRDGLADLENEPFEGEGSNEPISEPLQAALIALQPETGELYALVGGKTMTRTASTGRSTGATLPGQPCGLSSILPRSTVTSSPTTSWIFRHLMSFRVFHGRRKTATARTGGVSFSARPWSSR